MPSSKPFNITLGDINFLLDQMREAVTVLRYDAQGQAIYGYYDSTGVSHELGLFGTFNPLLIVDSTTNLSIYDGAREASGFRIPAGVFNNLVDLTRWSWGSANDPFPRLTQADYDNYVQQVLTNPALADYAVTNPGFMAVADNSANYTDLNTTVVDYTPRMITQTISSSRFGDPVPSALERTEAENPGLVTDAITSTVTDAHGNQTQQTENIIRNLNTLPGDPSTSGIFTLFGQFFDHGLDFIDKGGQGAKIVIPLAPTDPLYGAIGPNGQPTTTITISRATPDDYTIQDIHGRQVSIAGADGTWNTADDVQSLGADGVLSADDVHAPVAKPATTTYTDHTSPYIDQSQSYGSDTQITTLLRQWVLDPNTGQYRPGAELLDGHQTQAYNSQVFNDAGAGQSTRTVPTLAELRAHLQATGRDDLTWDDINNYRAREASGHVIDTNGAAAGGYVYTGQALLLDMNPNFAAINFANATIVAGGITAANFANFIDFSNFSIKNVVAGNPVTDAQYAAVSEALMESVANHYVAGDGRANENFGLTALHHVFHENHNVQLINLENTILTQGSLDSRHNVQVAVNATVPPTGTALVVGGHYEDANGNYTLSDGTVSWNQDKMFEATKLINEMEYQHVAIDQYARLVTPDLPEFVTYDNDINADISLEYSQAAFRFGHSQLRETIDAIDPNGMVTKFALSGAFLNPAQFAAVGASDIVRGMSQQLSNEVDEFVTPAMQQSLLGQPLDLAAINIARGRDLGLPTLNEVRRQLHDALVAERAADPTTPHHTNLIVDALNPYTSWAEFGSQMQHPESLVNFIAAYSFDGDLAKAQAIIGLENGSIAEGDSAAQGYTLSDAIAFLNGGDDGYNKIDLWIGGLAELHVFTGQLGTTFNAIFEDQMERLMDGDRMYYIYRLQDSLNIDTDLGHAIVTEQFKDIIERTTGVQHLNGDVMGYADSTIELAKTVDTSKPLLAVRGETIFDINGNLVTANMGDLKYVSATDHTVITQDFKTAHEYGSQLASHPGMGIYSGVGGGTAGNGTLITKMNSDSGHGSQTYIADFRPDMGENPDGTPASGYNSHEVIAGTDYNDWIDAGNGDDTAYGDKGDDILDGKAGADHLYGGDGQDVIYGGDIEDFLDGGEGDDIVYAGTSAGALDVVIGGGGNDKLYGEAGIDEIYGGAGDDYIDAGGDTDLAFGDGGNDIMFGGDGPDELRGGLGDDMLSGGSGADVLKGEGGDDILFGGVGQNAQNGDSDELLGDVGFDLAAFSDVSIVLNAAADLRNQNLVAAGGAAPFNPFSQLFADLEGVIGSKFADTAIGDDGNNWLIGGGGSDTFGTTVANTDGVVGSGGNDVIIGDSIRLDTLIGHFASYTNGTDTNGNATHGVTGTLTAGLLGTVDPTGQVFAKHFTDLLQTERNKDFVLGQDGGTAGTNDTAFFTGNKADYTITAISYNTGNPDGNITAYKVVDNRANSPDGTDLLVGVDKLKFLDQTVSLNNTAPALKLHAYDTGNYLDQFNSTSYSNSNGSTNWATSWTETGDTAIGSAVSNGQIRISSNQLQFRDNGDGATIQRAVNLSGVQSATLSYSYNENGFDNGETIAVSFAADGVNFTTVQTINGSSNNGNFSVALTGPFTANAAVRFAVSGGNSSNDSVNIDNVRLDYAKPAAVPAVNYATTFNENGSPVAIDAGPGITDDGTVIHSAKIVLTNAKAGDSFSLGSHPGIAASVDNSVAGQITINLTNDASLAAYQAALQAITFSNSSDAPDTTPRTINVTVNDGLADSNVAQATITVNSVNDAPNAGNDTIITNIANTSFSVSEWALLANDADPDGPNLDVTAVSNPNNLSGLTLATNPGSVTLSDTGSAGGSFTYTVSDHAVPTAGTDTANVTVIRDVTGNIDGGNGNEILVGDGGNRTFDAGTGNDIIFAGAGNDTIVWNANNFGATDGHDIVNGGANTATGDTFVVNGRTIGPAETFAIYSNTDDWDNNSTNGIVSSAAHAGFTGLNANTEIVIARNGAIIAELDNVEEITVNSLNTTANNGNGGPDGGTSGGDTIQVIGNFTGTSLNYSTITVNGGAGKDTVDITALTSDHRIVFNGNGGQDQLVGAVRPQDVVQLTTNGDNRANTLTGTANNDLIHGNGGDVTILGNAGNDKLYGDSGNDILNGGAGDDLLSGGAGKDTLVFAAGFGNDTVIGFEVGNTRDHDTLDLRSLGFASVAELFAHTDAGSSAVIHVGADTITLQGVTKDQLQTHLYDFLIS